MYDLPNSSKFKLVITTLVSSTYIIGIAKVFTVGER
jgi:hypothetical protein